MSDDQHIWSLMARKLSGEATAAEHAELEKLIRDQPAWQYAYEMLSAYWPASGKAASDEHALRQRFGRLQERIRQQSSAADDAKAVNMSLLPREAEAAPLHSNRKKRLRWAMAATVLLIMAAGIYLWQHHLPGEKEDAHGRKSEIVTRNGSKSKITLPDGSTVWLNAGSRLVYDNNSFGTSDREITLTGEGFFDVAHNARLPFSIHAGRINVLVLGTSFDVKSYPQDRTIETTLIRGSIEVSFAGHPEKKVLLKPRQKLTVFNDDSLLTESVHTVKKNNEENYKVSPLTINTSDSSVVETAWVQNKLAFRSASFANLAVQMERWYDVTIRFDDSKVKNYSFTGSFENESLDQALKALQITAPFSYRIEKDEVYISKP